MNTEIRALTDDEIGYVSGGTKPSGGHGGTGGTAGNGTGGGDGLGWLRNTVRGVAEGVAAVGAGIAGVLNSLF